MYRSRFRAGHPWQRGDCYDGCLGFGEGGHTRTQLSVTVQVASCSATLHIQDTHIPKYPQKLRPVFCMLYNFVFGFLNTPRGHFKWWLFLK